MCRRAHLHFHRGNTPRTQKLTHGAITYIHEMGSDTNTHTHADWCQPEFPALLLLCVGFLLRLLLNSICHSEEERERERESESETGVGGVTKRKKYYIYGERRNKSTRQHIHLCVNFKGCIYRHQGESTTARGIECHTY